MPHTLDAPIPAPGEPTTHSPGSAGKIATLAARGARGEQLFHPGDAGRPSRAPDHRTRRASNPSPGVTRKGRRFVARASIGGRQAYLGSFATEGEARRAVALARGLRQDGQAG